MHNDILLQVWFIGPNAVFARPMSSTLYKFREQTCVSYIFIGYFMNLVDLTKRQVYVFITYKL